MMMMMMMMKHFIGDVTERYNTRFRIALLSFNTNTSTTANTNTNTKKTWLSGWMSAVSGGSGISISIMLIKCQYLVDSNTELDRNRMQHSFDSTMLLN